MRLKIEHKTTYDYDAPVPYGLQQLRLRPKSRAGQEVLEWTINVAGGTNEATYEDEHANTVNLVSFEAGQTQISITCTGEVDVTDQNGVVGPQKGFVPLWLYQRSTPLTEAGERVKALVAAVGHEDSDLGLLHALSAHILLAVPYSTEQRASDLTAEQAITGGMAVCQDHAHIFISAARQMGFPARYVSGYLMMDDRKEQDASHAWAEAHVDGLGWVGFDVSNSMCPDDRYVRVATALDYRGAAPIAGMRFGDGAESMNVSLQVQQQ